MRHSSKRNGQIAIVAARGLCERMSPKIAIRALARLLFVPAALLMAAGSGFAHPPPAMLPDAPLLKKYDGNRNGRLDPDELAILQADQKSGQFSVNLPGHEKHVAWAWITVEHCGSTEESLPQYAVTLLPDGLVIFDGHDHLKATGTFTEQISPEKAAEIFARINKPGFWTLRATPAGAASTDFPADNIAESMDGKLKTLERWSRWPNGLTELVALFYEAADLTEWLGNPPKTISQSAP